MLPSRDMPWDDTGESHRWHTPNPVPDYRYVRTGCIYAYICAALSTTIWVFCCFQGAQTGREAEHCAMVLQLPNLLSRVLGGLK